jgi:Melibiase/Alpha galactosidase C-terminal beta sandwich domain
MRRALLLLTGIFLTALSVMAQNEGMASVSAHGWTVTADAKLEKVKVEHDGLGTLMDNVRLFRLEGLVKAPLRGWLLGKGSNDQFTIETAQPHSFWRFDLHNGSLTIATTASEAFINATVAAPESRQLARLMDPSGVPVRWAGTDEAHDGYGAPETLKQSYLPRSNSDVMMFALGPISASTLHSLFDRPTDTAIDFPERTSLVRRAEKVDELEGNIPVPGAAVLRVIPDYFTKTLGVPAYIPFDDSHFPRPPVVWSSWTSYYADVTEADIVRNADWLARNLKSYGFQFVQLDDGYDRDEKGQHYWIDNWNSKRFPHGPEWLAHYIKSTGLRAGIWLVPNAYAGAVQNHPDWYLRDEHGNLISDYSTPALDSSNPEVLEFLKKLFTTLDNWGFDYYKFDGEFAIPSYAPKVDHQKLFNADADPLATYRTRLKVIRDVLGPDRFIEGCPAGTPLNGIGVFQSYFNGDDLYNTWQGMYPLFSSINANAFLNHLVVYLMPGEGVELGPPITLEQVKQSRHPSVLSTARDREQPLTQFGTTLAEAHTLVAYLALTGVVYPLASVMPELPQERVNLLKMTLPPLPIFPMDLYSRGTDMQYDRFKYVTADNYIHNYPELLDLKVNAASGIYDVVGVTNWRSEATNKRVSFGEQLGLSSSSYLVFDFWNKRLLGVFDKDIDVKVLPHDTQVLLIHPVVDHPQLLGTARHISGSYSIDALGWEQAENRLHGRSTTIAGEPYSLWFRVPKEFTLSTADASHGNRKVPVKTELDGELLTLIIPGQEGPVDWELAFSKEHARSGK